MSRLSFLCTVLLVLSSVTKAQQTSFAMGIPLTAAENGLHGPVKEMHLDGEDQTGNEFTKTRTITYYDDKK